MSTTPQRTVAPGVNRVLRIIELEEPGDHFLSHFIFAYKVLRNSVATSIQLANGYRHRALTRAEIDGLVADWREEGWIA